jgi:hypothetical protein
MATFKFGHDINIEWNGYVIKGPTDTVFSIPDQLYEEFEGDLRPVEPTLTWIDINEFQTLKDSVVDYSVAATSPIVISSSTATSGVETKTWSLNASYATSTHNHNGTYQVAGNYASAVSATAPLSASLSSTGTISMSISTTGFQSAGSYQPAGTYVNTVVGSSPATVSTSSGTATVSISSGSAADGFVLTADGAGGVAFEASTGGGGISSLVGTTPISATVVGSSATVAINSGTNPNGYLLAANGTGGVIFTPASTSGLTSVVGVSPISTTIAGGTVSVILNASYQTAGTYVTGVSGTAPITASGTTAITVGIDQTALSVADATTATTLRTYVKNSSGSTISKGQVVYVTGADGTNALIGLSTASTEAGSSKTLGIAANTMTNNAFGYVIENGQLSNIDTSAATAGSSVWLGNTPGSYVFNSPPAEPSHSVYLGVVTKANVSTGEILVKVQNGYELDELHDVSAGSPTDLDIIQYKSSSALWTKASIANAGIAASTHTHDYAAAVHTHPQSAITNLVTDLGTINTAVTSAQTTANTASTTATNAVPKNIVTTKGDIIVGSAASAVDRLGVGTDGQILTARTTATNGVAWETAAAGGGSTTISFSTYTVSSNFATTDKDKLVQVSSSSPISMTMTSTATFNVGEQIHILQTGTGQVTIVAGTGVTINAALGLKLRAQWSSATLIERSANVWILIGDCEA